MEYPIYIYTDDEPSGDTRELLLETKRLLEGAKLLFEDNRSDQELSEHITIAIGQINSLCKHQH